MPYRAFYLTEGGALQKDLGEDQVRAAFVSQKGLLWVDIGETTEEDGRFLDRVFRFHPLTVEDCVDPAIHVPKVEDYNDYLFLTLRGINYTVESDVVSTTEINLFLGRHFVVSNHNVFMYSVDAIMRLVDADGRPMKRGSELLAYYIMDALVDNMIPTVERLSERADDIEDAIFDSAHESILEAITALKRSSLRLRRFMSPQREVLNLLTRRDFSQVSQDGQRYFRDIYDSVARLEGQNETIRERADTALAMYLSVVANRQNETMKVLSMVAAVFLPLGLLAGVYGMNFENMPELGVPWAYFAVVGFMAAVIMIAMWWFFARRWISAGRRRLKKFVPTAVDPERLVSYVGHMARRHLL
jgi:magnesium transporter